MCQELTAQKKDIKKPDFSVKVKVNLKGIVLVHTKNFSVVTVQIRLKFSAVELGLNRF